MKIHKMPTTMLLLFFSWLITILGFLAGGYLIIFRPDGFNSLLSGLLILPGTFLLALIIRMLGNAGQMLFDIHRNILRITIFFEQIERHLDLKK